MGTAYVSQQNEWQGHSIDDQGMDCNRQDQQINNTVSNVTTEEQGLITAPEEIDMDTEYNGEMGLNTDFQCVEDSIEHN